MSRQRRLAHVLVDMVSLYSEDDHSLSEGEQQAALAPAYEVEQNGLYFLPASMVVVKRLVRELALARGVDEDTVIGVLRDWVDVDLADTD